MARTGIQIWEGGVSTESKPNRWWETEYYEMLAEYQERTGDVGGRIISFDWPKPKLSDVLRCARLAKEQPEIWALAQEQAKIPIEEWDNDDNRMSNLIGPFEDWYIFKHGLQDQLPFAFASASLIFREWLQPDYDGDEIAAARRVLRPSVYFDDLTEEGDVQ